MKKIIFILITSFIICAAFNKPLVLVADYRDAFIGNYLCNSNCKGVRSPSNKNPAATTDVVTVSISKDAADSILQITLEKNIVLAKLKNNILQSYSGGEHLQGKFFATDSVAFVLSRLGSLCSYKGQKKQ